jgi:glycerophosphoryl diester phosphodiesterase
MLGLGNRLTTPLVKPYFSRTEATSLQVPHNVVNPNMIERAHELGIHVIVWPFKPERDDNHAYMEKALDQGVHGLMSDHTQEMKEAVLARDPNNRSIR